MIRFNQPHAYRYQNRCAGSASGFIDEIGGDRVRIKIMTEDTYPSPEAAKAELSKKIKYLMLLNQIPLSKLSN